MRRNWIKVNCHQWLRGTIRNETPIIRGLIIQLIALSMDEYPYKIISGGDLYICNSLNIPLKIWLDNKRRLKELGYLQEGGGIFLINPPEFAQPQNDFRPREYRFIFELDKYECVYCGDKKKLTIDHLMPQSRGGSNDQDNLVLACRHCNSTKHDKMPKEANMELKYGRFRISHEKKNA